MAQPKQNEPEKGSVGPVPPGKESQAGATTARGPQPGSNGPQVGHTQTAEVPGLEGPGVTPAKAPVTNANPTQTPQGGNESQVEDENRKQQASKALAGKTNTATADSNVNRLRSGFRELTPSEQLERDEVEQARDRSRGGNVFRVLTNILGGPKVGTIAADVDFDKNADFVDLMQKGCIEPVGGLKSDPRAMSRPVDSLDEVERLHGECTRLTSECERLTAENKRLTEELNG